MNTSNNTVIVAMSGGVDSTVCAALLKEFNFDVTGVTCKMFGSNVMADEDAQDAFLSNVEAAKRACRLLNAEHFTFNYKEAFQKHVIDHFVDEYVCGRTPNPCVDCNKHVKFGGLHMRRRELGIDYLATGHYARIEYDESAARWKLLRGLDRNKDQSYMLFNLTQDELAHTLFPLGDFSKNEIREIAKSYGFENAEAAESQDICFIPDGDYLSFVKNHCENALLPGEILDTSGNVIGKHVGVAAYTIGQRKGIGIAAKEPLFVIEKNAPDNTLVVGTRAELMVSEVNAKNVNYVSLSPEQAAHHNTSNQLRMLAKTSYRQSPRAARASFNGEEITIVFDEPIVRPAPGQALVLYDFETGQEVLAGGIVYKNKL